MLDWIWSVMEGLPFESVLDAFGGTGSVSHRLKAEGKRVTFNDRLRCNQWIGRAIVENSARQLADEDIEFVLRPEAGRCYDDVVARNFADVYYTDEENRWLDVVCQNIPRIADRYRRAIAYQALFQSCLAKRPYNLFHRKNLYMRTSDVRRSFGNKTTWDTPFEEHFRNFVRETNRSVFDNGLPCRALCRDALEVPGRFDLVYIDTPYVNSRGVGVDYLEFYHFLEGIVGYSGWRQRIDFDRKHRPLRGARSAWSDPKRTRAAFERLFRRYSNAILVVSYRSDGIPSEDELTAMLAAHKRRVRVHRYGQYKYALSRNGRSGELLLVGC